MTQGILGNNVRIPMGSRAGKWLLVAKVLGQEPRSDKVHWAVFEAGGADLKSEGLI